MDDKGQQDPEGGNDRESRWSVSGAYIWFLGNKSKHRSESLLVLGSVWVHFPQSPRVAQHEGECEADEIKHPHVSARLQTFGSKNNGDTMGSNEGK